MTTYQLPSIELRRPLTSARLPLVAVGLTALLADPALARIETNVRATTAVTYTDNVGLESSDGEDSIVGTLGLDGNVSGNYNRTSFAVGGNVSGSYFTNGSDRDDSDSDIQLDQSVFASGQYVVVRDSVFINADASSRRALIDPQRGTSTNPRANEDDTNAVHTVSLRPNATFRLGDAVVVNGSATYREIYVQGRANNNARVNSQSLSIGTGSFSRRASVRAIVNRSESDERGSGLNDDLERYSASVNGRVYVIQDKLALTGTAGYDWVNIEGTVEGEDDLSGILWNVGLLWNINRDSTAEIAGGERFNGIWYSGTVNYNITPKLSFSARANRSVETQLERIARGAQNVTFTENNVPINSETGEIVQQVALDLQDGTFVTDVVSATLVGSFGRAVVSLTGSFQDRTGTEVDRTIEDDVDEGGLDEDPLRDETSTESIALIGGVSYQTSRKTTLSANSFARRTIAPGRTLVTSVSNTIRLNYQASQRVSVFGAVTRTDQMAGDLKQVDSPSFKENAATIGASIQLF